MGKPKRYKLYKFFPELSSNCNYMGEEALRKVYFGLIKMIGKELGKYGKVELPELGTFVLIKQKPKMAIDVRSKILSPLPAINLVKFRPCREMKAFFKESIHPDDVDG